MSTLCGLGSCSSAPGGLNGCKWRQTKVIKKIIHHPSRFGPNSGWVVVVFLKPHHSPLIQLSLAAEVSIVWASQCYSARPPDPALPPHTCRLRFFFFFATFFSWIHTSNEKYVLSGLVRDRPAYQPGVSTSSDPPGAEGALRRRRCWIPLSSHGSNCAHDLRGTTRQVSLRLIIKAVDEWSHTVCEWMM